MKPKNVMVIVSAAGWLPLPLHTCKTVSRHADDSVSAEADNGLEYFLTHRSVYSFLPPKNIIK